MSSCSVKRGDSWDDNAEVENAKKMNDTFNIESSSAQVADATAPSSPGNCCVKIWQYGGIREARGYALLAMGRGAAVMSNGT